MPNEYRKGDEILQKLLVRFEEAGKKSMGNVFQLEGNKRVVASMMLEHMIRHPRFLTRKDMLGRPMSFRRGILLHGPTGIGKTWLLYALNSMTIGTRLDSTVFNCKDLEGAASKLGYSLLEQVFSHGGGMIFNDLALDDPTKFMGSGIDIVPLIFERLDADPEPPAVWASTNKAPKELAIRYEDRTYSRIIKQFNIITFTDKNLRYNGLNND